MSHLQGAKFFGMASTAFICAAAAFQVADLDGPFSVTIFAAFAFSVVAVGEIKVYEAKEPPHAAR